eukprot:TRINITY_DN959_c2_g1_i1.p1 TRINITY_DN959_c2_g1~~TRINITY_DN959_c2_g1_i1.p1  ORF type:complete len:824 (+),score=299.97 TRINITY_DN959_c2_g1_i1:105-2474(+)
MGAPAAPAAAAERESLEREERPLSPMGPPAGGPAGGNDPARAGAHNEPAPDERDRWAGRWSFIMAAVGSAVGLGNFWRFPYLVHKYGGGPFLIPYWVCLFVVGIPMLLLELSLGQKMQAGDIRAFGRIHPKLRGVGLASVFGSFMVVIYYTSIIAWSAVYFVESFMDPVPWAPWGANYSGNAIQINKTAPCMDKASYHFYHETLQLMDQKCNFVDQEMSGGRDIAGPVFGALVFTWVVVGASVFLGPRSASRVIWVSVPLPFVLSAVLFFRAVTLEGAEDGIRSYVGKWDWGAFEQPQLWVDAMSQIFFTLSVCFGVMTSYGSYRPVNTPVVLNAFIVALVNCIFSFFCGFIVFGTLGHMSWRESGNCRAGCHADPVISILPDNFTACIAACQEDNAVEKIAKSSIGLSFIVIPTVLETMGGAGNFFAVVTFAMLFTLGWDSAFSMVEAVTTVMLDAPVCGINLRDRLNGICSSSVFWAKDGATTIVTAVVCAVGICFGLLFTSEVGLYWLDITDHYISNYTLLIDGILQACAVGWVWGVPAMLKSVGKDSTKWFVGSYFLGGIAMASLTTGLAVELAPCKGPSCKGPEAGVGGELAIGFAALLLVIVPGWLMSFLTSRMTVGRWWRAVVFAGADELMDYADGCSPDSEGRPLGQGQGARDFFGAIHRVWWSFMIKYVSPILLTMFFIIGFKVDVDKRYGGYQQWMQNVLWIVVAISICIFLVFVFLPGDYPRDIVEHAHVEPAALPAVIGRRCSVAADPAGDKAPAPAPSQEQPAARGAQQSQQVHLP